MNSQGNGRTLRLTGAALLLASATALVTGCGGGANSNGTAAPPTPPAIAMQPASQSVPMGLAAQFSIAATGSSLQFQWKKNGAAIAGATNSSYTTPPTAFADTDAAYTVTVSNAAGVVDSAPATLTVTARAPMAGDLRFQQVDSAATVNGYGNAGTGLSTDLVGRMLQYFTPALGTPFQVGTGGNCVTPPVTNGLGCAWMYSEIPLAAGISNLITAYGSDTYANFLADLQPPSTFGINPATPIAPGSVITSLDLEPDSALFALAWVQSSTQAGYDVSVQTVAPADLAAAATQAGAASRVITAISHDGSQVTFLSYGWQSDPATVYDVQVATASATTAPSAAANLAAQGYIITATGLADTSGNIYLVGTRVHGDTLARPFIIAQDSAGNISPNGATMMQQGYATVGVIFNWPTGTPAASATYTTLGER